MTRDEYLRKLRGEFIDRHLALPGWMERLPPWLREYFRILYWVFFRPSALRLYLDHLAREAKMEVSSARSLLLFSLGLLILVMILGIVLLTAWFYLAPFTFESKHNLVSMALGMVGGMLMVMVFGADLGLIMGLLGIGAIMVGGMPGGITFPIGILIGLTRLPFWIWEVFLPYPPISWDELPVLPWPKLPGWLAEKMRDSREAAMWLSFTARHPAARWALSHAVFRCFVISELRLAPLLRSLLCDPLPYVEPQLGRGKVVRLWEADPYFSSKRVLHILGQSRSLPATLSYFFRDWYHLLEAAAPTNLRDFDPNRLVKALKEAHKSSSALGEAAEELPALLNAFVSLAESPKIGALPLFPREAPNFPEVLKGLCLFEKAAQAFTAYQAASGELARRDYLNEALSALERVRQMAAESPDVPQPFAALLLLISERWYQTVAAERDRLLALRPVSPLEDFYVVGLPLTPESGRLFVGRDEIFRRLEELFRNPFQKGPVVLCGQRRMGKTSILRHIGVRLGPSYIPVLADLQGLLSDPYRPIRSDRDLWLALMREIGKPLGVSPREGESVEEFLDRIAPARGERFIVLMLDEFEKLEQRMDEGAVSRGFLEYLRHLIQHRPELLVVLSGHHTLQERMGRYWEPLMGVARSVRVSYLEEDAARRLITDPWDGFRLQYTGESIQRLLMATGCQPMLLQLACSAVIREVNNRMKREGYEVYPTARPEEVERALDQLLREGETWYFDAVWDWLTEEQRAALIRLAQAYRPGSEGWILWQEVPGVTGDTVRALEAREVLEVEDGRCRFRVELLRRWLARRSPSAPPPPLPPDPSPSRFTFHVLRFTFHVSRFTLHVSLFPLQ
jgi:hypothetical protein